MKDNKDKLIEKLEEYILLLGKEIDDLIGIAHVHGWISCNVEQGKKLREEIKALKDSKESQFKRLGLFLYREVREDVYEVGLDVPIKFTKKHQKEIEEYVRDVFGEDSQFEMIGEETVATKKFLIQKKNKK